MVSGVPLVPFSECKITDFFHSHQMFSQLFFKKKLREKDKALKDNALRPEKIFDFFSVDNTAKVGNAKNMAKTCGGIFRVLCRRTWFRKENWERKTVIALLYIWAELSQHNCSLHFATKWATMLHPILRQGIRLFIGTTSKTRNYILLSTRGRRSCCSRPKVALLAADGSITRGRE